METVPFRAYNGTVYQIPKDDLSSPSRLRWWAHTPQPADWSRPDTPAKAVDLGERLTKSWAIYRELSRRKVLPRLIELILQKGTALTTRKRLLIRSQERRDKILCFLYRWGII